MSISRLWMTITLIAAASGCTLISDLDRFEQADGGGSGSSAGLGCGNEQTLCVRLTHFTPHMNDLVDVDLVSANHALRSRAILDPMGQLNADTVLPLAISETDLPKSGAKLSPLHLEIWGDQSHDRKYTAAIDHDWIVPLPASGTIEFIHNSAFEDLLPRPRAIGGNFVMNLTGGFDIHTGKLFEVMVIEKDTGRTSGLYRLHAIPASGKFTVEIPEIIDPGVLYRIEYYADANGNGKYDGLSGGDHSWVIEAVESDDTGLTIDRPHSGPDIEQTELSYQFPFKQ